MYLEDVLGFPLVVAGEEERSASNKSVYDTTFPGYGSEGHTYGDSMNELQRGAVLEYLTTL